MTEKLHARRGATAERVLIIEGISALSEELARCLTRAGSTVARIPNCPETLLTMHVFKPDIVVVDETAADSFEVCNQIRNAVGTPVLLVGEDPSTDIWTKALVEAGADFYLRKPFDGEVLVAQLRAILARYHKTPGGSIQSQTQERHRAERRIRGLNSGS